MVQIVCACLAWLKTINRSYLAFSQCPVLRPYEANKVTSAPARNAYGFSQNIGNRGATRFGQVIRAVPRLELANLALNHKRMWQCKRGEFPAPPATSTVFADLGAAAGLHLQRRIKKICVVARGNSVHRSGRERAARLQTCSYRIIGTCGAGPGRGAARRSTVSSSSSLNLGMGRAFPLRIAFWRASFSPS